MNVIDTVTEKMETIGMAAAIGLARTLLRDHPDDDDPMSKQELEWVLEFLRAYFDPFVSQLQRDEGCILLLTTIADHLETVVPPDAGPTDQRPDFAAAEEAEDNTEPVPESLPFGMQYMIWNNILETMTRRYRNELALISTKLRLLPDHETTPQIRAALDWIDIKSNP